MKIERLELERFGHFEGKRLSLIEGDGRLCIVHGDNEAGKTTILEAIRCLLFGFPERAAHFAIDVDQSSLAVSALIEFSDGKHALVRRGKRRVGSLEGQIVEGGDAIDDEWFHGKLSRPNRAVFENVFGFSLDMLTRGAESLKHDAVKSAIYGAGFAGAVHPQKILDDLGSARTALFKERGTEPRINAAARRLDELRKAVRSTSAKGDEYRKLSDELVEKERVSVEQLDASRKLRATIEAKRAVLRGLEPFEAMRRAQEELELSSVPPAFPVGGAHEHERLLETRARLLREEGEQGEALSTLAAELEALVVDEHVLAHGNEIDALYRGLEAHRQLLAEHPQRVAELDELRRASRQKLASLRPTWDLSRLRAARFDAASKSAFDDAVARHGRLEAETAHATRELRTLEEGLRAIDDKEAALSAPRDVSPLTTWLDGWSGFVAERDQRRRLARELDALARKGDALRARLDPPHPRTGGDPAELPVPRLEEVAELQGELVALDLQRLRLDEQLAEKRAELSTIDEDLLEIEAGGHAPTEAELESARARRQEGWRLVARALAGEGGAREAKGYDAERPLPRAYEHAVQLADDVADRMRRRADAVQRRSHALTVRDKTLRAIESLDKARGSAQSSRAAWCERWGALWARCGFSPLTPAAMRGWLSDRQSLIDVSLRLADLRGELGEVERRVEDFLTVGRTALAMTGSDESLRAAAQRLVDDESTRARAHEALAHQRARDRARSIEARDRLIALRGEADRWCGEWKSLLEALGVDDVSGVGAARTLVESLIELRRELVSREDALDERLAAISRAIESYRARLIDLDRAGAALDSVLAVERVHGALVASQRAQLRRGELSRALDSGRRRLASLAESRALAEGSIVELHAAAGVTDERSFRSVAERVERAELLGRTIDESLRALRAFRGHTPLDEYLGVLSTAVRDSVEAELVELQRQSDELEVEVRALEQSKGAVRESLRRIDGNAIAAELLAEAEGARATLRDSVERYAVLTFAQEILQGAIRRFEREHQPELLEIASRVFSEMTLGKYPHVQRRIDGTLFVERADGRGLAPDQLSTGAREQLYLAIRLAYVEHYRRSAEPLPIVLDDVLVNFDPRRATATLAALASFARTTQVLLFTCHDHLITLAEGAGIDALSLSIPRA